MAQLPRSQRDTDDLPVRQRYSEWREWYNIAFGYELDKHQAAKEFHA